jgi:hypothetical protein
MANANYQYHIQSVQFCSYLGLSQFYNSAADSGFVYFNSKNIFLGQSAYVNKVTASLNFSYSANIGYSIYTIENSDQFALARFISVGGGVKMIRHTLENFLQWGYSGNVTLKIGQLGDLSLQFDRGFVPGLNRSLVPNNMGRLTYFKTF